ncbi:hypothetical protein GGI20_005703 [Coemansia sp. BCRC 34301]|nr:hypothetical protein GGI20_005703 [Coemansia sp. BCRC 34301]
MLHEGDTLHLIKDIFWRSATTAHRKVDPRLWPERYKKTPYDIFEAQNTSRDTCNLKPDILITSTERDGATFQDVFLFVKAKKPVGGTNAYLDKIGQLADYALALRECQPTRTFIPTPTNRLPEGTVYEALVKGGVSSMPQIFASGILIRDLFGYRLEFLVMEHCSTLMVEYIQSKLGGYTRSPQVTAEATLYVEQVMQTLTEALGIGVLHRDTSAGNIAIKGGKAYAIDWGYSKFLRQSGDDEFAEAVATRWDFDWVKVLKTENTKDPFTGTPLYMSFRLLLGAKKRSIYDDFESLLYVMLDAFSNRPRAKPTLDSAQHNTDDGGDIVDVGTSRSFSKLKLGTGAFPVSPLPAARNDPLVRGEAHCSLQSPLGKMSRPLVFNPGAEDPKGKRVDTTISDADDLAMETESDPT